MRPFIFARLTPLLAIILFTIMFFTVSLEAWAYPDLVRHGYASCLACHVSPTGGGLTTPYGRSLSKELVSHWGREGEEKLLYKTTPPEWLNIGGDVRAIQTYVNTRAFKQARFFQMQTDLEVAVSYKNFYADTTAGVQEGPESTVNRGHFLSRRHFIGYRPKDELSLRTGRFQAAYGLNLSDHTAVTRRNLGFDENTETDNIEGAIIGENADLFLTGIFGRTDEPWGDWEHGAALSTSYFFMDRFKVGFSLLHGDKSTSTRDLVGLNGILGFSKKLYAISEVDLQMQSSKLVGGAYTHGGVSYQQLNYEFLQGLHVYLAHQVSYLDFSDVFSRVDSWGAGTELYPRPHLDFQLELRKERAMALYTSYYDVGWVVLHYYL